MNKNKKRATVVVLALISLLCVGAGSLFAGGAPLSANAEGKALSLGEELFYTAEADLASVVKATSQTGTVNGAVSSVYTQSTSTVIQANITRGETAVLQFSKAVSIREYPVLTLTLGKNISAFATLDFYKNETETVIGETKSAFNYYFYAYSDGDGASTAAAERKEVALKLSDFADENGYVESILVTHTSDERAAGDYANFFLTVYGAELQSLANEHAFLPNVGFTAVETTEASISPSVTAEYPKASFAAQSGYTEEKVDLNEFTRGKATVLQFATALNTAKYTALSFDLSKNIGAKATFDFYKNEAETVIGETKSVYTAVIEAATNERQTVTLPLADFADENGEVASLILVHTADEKDEDFEAFSVSVYEITANYALAINGEDMVCAQPSGAEFVKLTTHLETQKMYANGFSRGKAVEIKFGSVLNANFYKTLKLSLSLNNVSASYTYYLMGFESGTRNVASAAPAGRYAISNNETVALEIALEDYADVSGAVSGLVLWHYGDTYASDFDGLSLFVFGAEVCVAEPQSAKVSSFPCEIEEITYEKGAERDLLVVDFDSPLFTEVDKILVGGQELSQYFRVNGEAFAKEDVLSVTTGYGGRFDRMAVALKSKILNDGTDCLEILGLRVTDGGCTYVAASDMESYFPKPLQNGESAKLVGGVEVLTVRSSASDTATEIAVAFSIPLGEIAGYGSTDGVLLNGQSLTALQSQGVTATADGNLLKISVPNTANLLKGDGTDTLSVEKGFASEGSYMAEKHAFTAYDGAGVWFKQVDKPLRVLWLQDLAPEKNTTSFTIKVSNEYARGGGVENFTSQAFSKIEINGSTLTEILQTDERARADLRGQYLDVTLSAAGYGHCIKFDESDLIVIKKGFTLPQGGETEFDTRYVYDALWEQFSVVPDLTQVRGEVTTVSVELVQTDIAAFEDGTTMIFVKFAYPPSYRFYPYMQSHVSMMPSRLASISASNPSELFLSELALYGVFNSALDKLYFDGLSMREWMMKDKRTNVDWKDIVDVRFLGTGFNDGYSMQFIFSKNASASLLTDGEHYVEFKTGFITPNLNVVQKDVKYKWNESLQKWEGVALSADEKTFKNGCGAVAPTALLPTLLLSAVAVLAKKRKGGEDDA